METAVFLLAGAICLAGALGVVLNRNPVHAALSLVATLFGIAVLFIAQDAHFLAAVQVIVYAGAIVVLFLFVIMLLGVDRTDDLTDEPLTGQRAVAGVVGLAVLALPLVAIFSTTSDDGDAIATGATSVLGAPGEDPSRNVHQLGEVLFTDYIYAFEITSVLLVIAVVGAVLLSRRHHGTELLDGELPSALEERQQHELEEDDEDDEDATDLADDEAAQEAST